MPRRAATSGQTLASSGFGTFPRHPPQAQQAQQAQQARKHRQKMLRMLRMTLRMVRMMLRLTTRKTIAKTTLLRMLRMLRTWRLRGADLSAPNAELPMTWNLTAMSGCTPSVSGSTRRAGDEVDYPLAGRIHPALRRRRTT